MVSFAAPALGDARFAPVDLGADVKALPPDEQRALGKLVEAARLMDTLFLRQGWAGNEAMLLELARTHSPKLGEFIFNKGPWSELDKNAPFIAGAPPKPESGNFYPPGATKAELEAWMKKLPDAERARAAGFFTTIRRAPDGKFTIVPYSVEYQPELAQAAALLREAAALTKQPALKTFLEKRAAAFLSNDYYDSDLAWMALDGAIEPTIGPYEVYVDEWFNYKAAFEAFITLRDDTETKKLERFSVELQNIENNLPIDPKLRNPKIGALAPIRVVNQIFCSGDAAHGVQTAAFNLPNDERIEKEHGTKRVMLKNVQEAKFNKVLVPIAKLSLSSASQKDVSFDAFFTHILMHELMHGLGPHVLTLDGKPATVRDALQNHYSAIEEAKADIAGLFAMQFLIDKGVLSKSMEKTMYVTFLASAFRSIRFGVAEAHGKGQALQLNYLVDAGGFTIDPRGTFSVDPAKIKDAVTALTRELMTIEGTGNRARAQELLEKLGVVRPETQKLLDKMKAIPVDIAPRFVTAEKLATK
jgi:hypothetical protein